MYQITTGGCHARHAQGFIMSRENGLPRYVLLIVHSGGEFIIDGCSRSVAPRHAVIIAPHTPYQYLLATGDYMDDWLHFETDTPDLLPPCNQLFPIRNADMYTSLVQQLLWERSYTSDAAARSQNTDALFSVLCNHLTYDFRHNAQSTPMIPYEEELRRLRLDIQSHAGNEYSIAGCADKLHISISYFQSLYRRLFGISFQRDVIAMRIDYAKTLLETSDLSIADVGKNCGYQTEVHFFRQFKSHTGMTPREYRNNSI